MTTHPLHPYNSVSYPHCWTTTGVLDHCSRCGVPRRRVAADDPYPCRAAMPDLNPDGTIKEPWAP